MNSDELWNKFTSNGSIDAYLNYVNNKNKQGNEKHDGFNSTDDRGTYNKGTGYR